MTESGPSPLSSNLIPDFVVCGNVVRDITPSGWIPGGTAVYAAAVARALGRRVGVVTTAPVEVVEAGLGPDIAVARADAREATAMENVYTPAGRVQFLRTPGEPIPAGVLPAGWEAAQVTLLGPVYHEVDARLAARFQGRLGVCAQGFLRQAGTDGRVMVMSPESWNAEPVLQHARALFLSEEDLLGGTEASIPRAWIEAVPITVLTAGWRGARVHANGRWHSVPAVPVDEVNPTGAGDSFAAAFMVADDEGAGPIQAARFAAAVASFTVESEGPRTPTRDEALARMRSAFGVSCGRAPWP
jgi:1D-myo-inositol 3-kinase